MKYFGTDGFRGEANVTLTADHAFKIGRFLGQYFQDGKHRVRVIVGKDTRLSGYMYETALAAGLTASGADVYEIHVTTTPSISYLIREKNFDFGIMITASHNPYTDNGIKVINGQGHKLQEEIEEKIEKYMDGETEELPYATGENLGRCYDYTEGKEIYKDYLEKLVGHSFQGKTVALDLSNGSASRLADTLFEKLGAKIHTINDSPDGMNINRHCGSTHIDKLQDFVRETGADVGFAYDGDADRCLAVDECGGVVTGDHIMYVCGQYLKKQGKLKDDTVVTTVMSNMGLYKAFDQAGIQYRQTAVGDKYVCADMMENDYVLGGEQSGHIIFREHAVTGDGILTSLMIMEAMLSENKTLSELTEDLTIYPQLLVNVRVKDKVAAREDADVKAAEQEVKEALGNEGRLLLRESGTEPLIRVMVEAKTDEICRQNVDRVVSVLRAKGHEVTEMKGAYHTKQYRNVFAECGHSQEEIDQKLKDAFHTVFYGPDGERFYFEAGDDMGYFEDTGNHDARTEGMSYAMMMCVQMDMKQEFDRIWKWARTNMYMEEGYNKGYFAWSCQTNGEKNDYGPAPDGEEFFAMALFFASHRWGDGEGIFEYSQEAKNILSACIHNGEKEPGDPIMDPENYLIRFIPSRKFSDPSYHCPHFYELFSEWANEEDREFWKKAAQASREYLKKACHPETGLAAEYAYYDGTPYPEEQDIFGGRHDWYYSDSYRVIANIGLDYEWFAPDDWNKENNNKVQKFFMETHKDEDLMTYEIDGTVLDQPALHPVAIIATNAQASLAADGPYAKECVEKFWNTPLRTGDRRYYDNCLYLFALLALSGNYRIW